MAERPSGTVTFLLTDIEGSTRLLSQLGPDRYRTALEDHRRIVRNAFTRHDGHEVDTEGDSFLVAFRRATDAVQRRRRPSEILPQTRGPMTSRSCFAWGSIPLR